jgi:hypothetical protein
MEITPEHALWPVLRRRYVNEMPERGQCTLQPQLVTTWSNRRGQIKKQYRRNHPVSSIQNASGAWRQWYNLTAVFRTNQEATRPLRASSFDLDPDTCVLCSYTPYCTQLQYQMLRSETGRESFVNCSRFHQSSVRAPDHYRLLKSLQEVLGYYGATDHAHALMCQL